MTDSAEKKVQVSVLDERKAHIEALYKTILLRSADSAGLEHYLNSNLSIDEIKDVLENSLEYQQLSNKQKLKKDTKALGGKESIIMGSTPRKQEHIIMLSKANISAALCLDKQVTYPTEWCSEFLHVPLERNKPISKIDLTRIVEFLHKCVYKSNHKVFIHSEFGIERAPLVLSLFLVVAQDLTLKRALQLVRMKRKEINPSRSMVTYDLLNHAYNLREMFTGSAVEEEGQSTPSAKIVRASDRLYLGMSVDVEYLEILKKNGVKTIIDLNEKSFKIDSSLGSWFAHMKIPVTKDQVAKIMPIVIKTARKYMSRGPVYLVCSNQALLFMFVDTYVANRQEDDIVGSVDINSVREALMLQ